MIVAKCKDGLDMKTGEEMIWPELRNLISNPPTEREFQKVKNKNRANATFNNIKIADKALNLAYYAHLDMLERINTEKDYYAKVTVDDLTALAQRIFFTDKHNTLYYSAKK